MSASPPLPITIAADHGGYELKTLLITHLASLGYEALDLGTQNAEASVDYPDFAALVAQAIATGQAERGILVCGSGIGISIAANRHRHIRCALVHDVTTARLAREHNNANVLALGARILGTTIAKECVAVFLATAFAGGRHAQRIEKLS